MSVSVIGRRYAKALFALAEAEGEVDAVGTGLRDFAASLEESEDLQNVFDNPRFGAEARAAVLHALAEPMGLPDTVENTLKMLADRGRMRHVGQIAEAYAALAEARSGRVRAEVTTATELPEGYFTELKATLEKVTGREVTLSRHIDADLLGGVVTRIGDHVYDGSLRHRLTELKDELLSSQGKGTRPSPSPGPSHGGSTPSADRAP